MADKEFAGKAVIVTGAASGLGRATALAFAPTGAKLALADINVTGLDETVSLVKAAGGEAIAIPTDVSDPAAGANLVKRAVEAFGRLDALCNVAGLMYMGHVANVKPAEWDKIFAINVRGPFFIIQAALPHLIESEGAIVNVASSSGTRGHAYISPYAASKAALINLTQTLAIEYSAHPIRINAILPGGMITPMATANMIPEGIDYNLIARYAGLKGMMPPEELVDQILYLASPRNKSMHGALVLIDRGAMAG